jgi:hypothetical protein
MLILSIGKRYRGKTTAGYHFIRKMPARFVFDPRHDFNLDGATVTHDPKPLHFEGAFLDGPHDVTIRPLENANEELARLCTVLQRYSAAHCRFGLLLDECRFFKEELKKVNSDFDKLVRYGSQSLVIVLTAHRVTDIPPDVRAIADLWCVFHTTHQADLKTYEEHFGDPRLVEQIRALKKREFLSWDDGEQRARFHRNAETWAVKGLHTQASDVSVPNLPDAEIEDLFDVMEIGEE